MNDLKIQRYFCNDCGQKTKHFVRGEYANTSHDDERLTTLCEQHLIIECCGCEHLGFVRRTQSLDYIDLAPSSEPSDEDWDESIYPPVTYRAPPPWFEDLPDPTLGKISREIYKSLQTESLFLATFGSRTLIDRLMVLVVGDKGNFVKGLSALQEDGKISQHEREILEPILQAGHAAAHRGWAPTLQQFNTILDTVEGLIHRLLVLPKLAEELEEAVPGRAILAQKSVSELTVKDKVNAAPVQVRAVYEELEKTLRGFGGDVSVHPQKHYIAFRRNRNFASVQVYNQKKIVRAYLNIEPEAVDLTRPEVRDVRQIGHFGTGDLEVTLKSKRDIETTLDLLRLSYDIS